MRACRENIDGDVVAPWQVGLKLKCELFCNTKRIAIVSDICNRAPIAMKLPNKIADNAPGSARSISGQPPV
jgi:hypothetical protein